VVAQASLTLGALAMSIKAKPVAVAELFTSQGCSSCPAADAFLSELAKREDVVTLAYHVDYWNYIGWEDTFSDKKHSDLQRQYAVATGSDQIYTPQLLINGGKNFVGSHKSKIDAAISQSQLPVEIQFAVNEESLTINIPAHESEAKKAIVWLVYYRTGEEVKITRGENRGKTLRYSSIVHDRQIVGMWYGERSTEIMMPMPQLMNDEIDGLAVLLQTKAKNGLPGKIIGAAAIEK
jgi:hypothetical protein